MRDRRQDECEKFLARQHPAVRAYCKGELSSPSIPPFVAVPGGIEALNKALDEYEELLKRCPKHEREYRKRSVSAII